MNLDRLKYLAGVEVMSWKSRDVDRAICEGNGPLVVRREGEIVRSYPWHCVPFHDAQEGVLYIQDMLRRGRIVGEHRMGTFDQCAHEPKFKVILLPRVGDDVIQR